MKKSTGAALGFVSLAGAAVAAGGGYFYRFAVLKRKDYNNIWTSATRPQPTEKLRGSDREKVAAGIRFIFENQPEEIYVESRDCLKLCGHLIAHENPNGVFVLVHGYRSNPSNDFSGAVQAIYDMGFSLLLIDQRAHGNSEGKHISFGVRERFDLLCWCEYLKERFPDLPVVLDGVSMGASTVMLASGLALPDNVKALICDCGYTSPREICQVCLKKWYNLPAFPIYYSADLFARIFAKFSFSDVDSRDALSRNRLPILIAHGTDDDFVPYSMSEKNIRACTACSAELFSAEGAAHGMSYIVNPDGYMKKVRELLAKAGISWNEPSA